MFEIDDKVRVIKQRKTKNYENTYGKEGFIVYIDYRANKYGIDFPDIQNPASGYGRYYFNEGELELVESKIPTLEDIVARSLTCVIHTPNRKDAMCVVGKIPSSNSHTTSNEWLGYWDNYEEDTCYYIVEGTIDAYGSKQYYEESIKQGRDYLIYKFSDLFATGGMVSIHDVPISEWCNPMQLNDLIVSHTEMERAMDALEHMANNVCVRADITDFDIQRFEKRLADISTRLKEEKKMPTFTITEGTRTRNPHEKDKPKTIETISTTVRTEYGQATTTCDKSDYYDIYTGTLVAAAKITANKSEEALLLYKTAIDMWGNEMCFSILKALANRAFDNEKFDWAYKKWRKAVAYEERQKDTKARTCSVCGKVFKTVEEARAHEKWHEDCRTRKIERRVAKRRIARAEREGRITEYMTELLEKRKKNDEKKNKE